MKRVPIILRAAIYMALAGLPVLIAFFTDYVKDLLEGKPPMTHWAVFTLLGLNAIYQMLLVLRVYIDGSFERAKQQSEAISK